MWNPGTAACGTDGTVGATRLAGIGAVDGGDIRYGRSANARLDSDNRPVDSRDRLLGLRL